MNTLYTLGDSVLDCGVYNPYRVTPAQLIKQNRDDLFPDFKGLDLRSHNGRVGKRDIKHVKEHAVDGATILRLPDQVDEINPVSSDICLISVGGNDFLQGLWRDEDGSEINDFLREYGFILSCLKGTKLIANVYDPFFGKNMDNALFGRRADYTQIRTNYEKLNRGIERLATRYGELINLRDHFLGGDDSWYVRTIEPSLSGASEIRRIIWKILERL